MNPDPTPIAAPLEDSVYCALMTIVAPGALAQKVQTAWNISGLKSAQILDAKVLQIHYSPWTRGRVLAELTVRLPQTPDDRVSQFIFIHIVPEPAQARERLSRALPEPGYECLGPPRFLIDEWNAIVWSLPNAPKLREAAVCFDRRLFGEFLTKLNLGSTSINPLLPEMIRYVPRKRALFRYQPKQQSAATLYLKFYTQSEDETAAANLELLTKAADSAALLFQPPEMLGHDRHLQVVVLKELPGVQLTQLLASPDPALFKKLGVAMASLHTSGLRPDTVWTPEIELTALDKAMQHVGKGLPALRPRLERLLARIRQYSEHLVFEVDKPVHGNLFGDQILIARNNSIGIVDWDDLCTGDPLFDVGRLIAHFIFFWCREGCQPATYSPVIGTMLESYAKQAGIGIDHDRLLWHVSVALLLRAKISSLRTLNGSWIVDIINMVKESERILSLDSPWLPHAASDVVKIQ